jgi:hypothetical protein
VIALGIGAGAAPGSGGASQQGQVLNRHLGQAQERVLLLEGLEEEVRQRQEGLRGPDLAEDQDLELTSRSRTDGGERGLLEREAEEREILQRDVAGSS